MSLLELEQVSVALGKARVLREVSFRVGSGEFIGLIGPNGAGKSTLLRAIIGLVPSEGAISSGGRALDRMSAPERARLLSYLPQEREIAWPVTVERLVQLGRAPYLRAFARPGPRDRDAVAGAMARMDVGLFADRPATDLSGGERARVLIARALAQEAPLLLADEPAAGLDLSHRIELMKTFAGIARDGSSVIACLHDLGSAARWCNRLILLDKGAIVADGEPECVLTVERIRSVYNVEAQIIETAHGIAVHPVDVRYNK